MRPTLKQFQYLVALAEAGKVGEAAKVCHVSQPSLSAQLADMETELGVQLVERGRHGAIMTPEGQEVVLKARMILAAVEELKSAVRKGNSPLSGHLRLGVIPSIGPYLLPAATRRLHALFPDLRISVREERTIDLDLQLRQGRLDALISTVEDHANVLSHQLFTEKLWICVASDHELAAGKGPVSLSDLEGKALLSLGYGHNMTLAIRELARLSGAFINSEYEGTSLDAIRQMAAMGAGAAVLPSLYALVEARRDPSLVVREIDHASARRHIGLVWRDTSPLGEKMVRLATILNEVAQKLI